MSPQPQPAHALLREGFSDETCGTCRFGILIDPANIMVRECRGAPPTPCVVNIQPAAGGRLNFSVELIRPRVAASDAACGLHRTKQALILTKNS